MIGGWEAESVLVSCAVCNGGGITVMGRGIAVVGRGGDQGTMVSRGSQQSTVMGDRGSDMSGGVMGRFSVDRSGNQTRLVDHGGSGVLNQENQDTKKVL